MKRKMIIAMALTMLLCGCNEANSNSAKESSTEKTTVTTASQEDTTASETTTDAENTTAESGTTEASTADGEDSTDSDSESTTASLNNDLFEGLYYDKTDSNDSMSIDCKNDTLYNVHISRKKSDNETVEWYFTGEFNGRQVLNYENCVKSTMTVGEDGSVMSGTEYTDGTGYIQISETGEETGFVWHDEKENAGEKDFFIKK